MKKEKIRQIGSGMGAGEIIEALPRKKIEKIIRNLDYGDVFKMAFKNHVRNYHSGYTAVDLESGKLIGFGLSQGEEFQACDNNHIVLYSIPSYRDVSSMYDCKEDELEDAVDMDTFEWLELENYRYQLDQFYNFQDYDF